MRIHAGYSGFIYRPIPKRIRRINTGFCFYDIHMTYKGEIHHETAYHYRIGASACPASHRLQQRTDKDAGSFRPSGVCGILRYWFRSMRSSERPRSRRFSRCSAESVRSESISVYTSCRCANGFGCGSVFWEPGCWGMGYTLPPLLSSIYASLLVRPCSRAYSETLLPDAPHRLQRYWSVSTLRLR